MKKVKFIVEETTTGYSAITEDNSRGIVVTTGETIEELRTNALEAYNALMFDLNKKPITADKIAIG